VETLIANSRSTVIIKGKLLIKTILPRRMDDKANPKCLWPNRSPRKPKTREKIERRAT